MAVPVTLVATNGMGIKEVDGPYRIPDGSMQEPLPVLEVEEGGVPVFYPGTDSYVSSDGTVQTTVGVIISGPSPEPEPENAVTVNGIPVTHNGEVVTHAGT